MSNVQAGHDAHAVLPPGAVDRWRERWQEAQRDTTWFEGNRLRDEQRRQVLPEISGLAKRFLDRNLGISEFRETFDRKTRNEWDLFGLKGLSGAMFLNKLVKHLSDQDELTRELQTALTVPVDENAARLQIDDLTGYLYRKIEEGSAALADLQPKRAPFLLSAIWHMQQPDRWPIIYRSARKALMSDGVLGNRVAGGSGYLEFARVFAALADGVGIPFWNFEHLCSRVESAAGNAADDGRGPGDDGDEGFQGERVWLVAPGRRASEFDRFYDEGIVAIGWESLGDLSNYVDREAIRLALQEKYGGNTSRNNDALACYQFAHEMQVGDVVFAKRGRNKIIGYGLVASAYRHEPGRRQFTHVRSVEWKKRDEWEPRERSLVMKTLTEIGKYPGLVADIRRALGLLDDFSDDDADIPEILPPYRIDDAADDLFLSREQIEEAHELLQYKKNLVLQGPPGVGKTFIAKRLAYLLVGERDPMRVSQVQFHQSYSYEDFVQGYRPIDDGKFALADGPFLRFCDQALQDQESPYVLLIDEINRGNLSKIFGELLLLIEADKRSATWATTLSYAKEGDEPFYVPNNLHIIGTMNTADRSLALVDYALRRRFSFFDIEPAFEHGGFVRKLTALGAEAELRNRIVERFKLLNERISDDQNLGAGFRVGHSYFCHANAQRADDTWYQRIIRTEIRPLLQEYWFDNASRVDDEVASLSGDD
ncbi:MAG: AAA family ATPase [Gammaproteobacteria bacterium]|nr:AAA family ATPase [Gammaproteobacteria bacterium]